MWCRYAMREALAISAEEGLKEQWQRHEAMHHMLWDGLKSMGLKSFVDNDSERLITVNTIKVTPPWEATLPVFICPQTGTSRAVLGCTPLVCKGVCFFPEQLSMPWGWKKHESVP